MTGAIARLPLVLFVIVAVQLFQGLQSAPAGSVHKNHVGLKSTDRNFRGSGDAYSKLREKPGSVFAKGNGGKAKSIHEIEKNHGEDKWSLPFLLRNVKKQHKRDIDPAHPDKVREDASLQKLYKDLEAGYQSVSSTDDRIRNLERRLLVREAQVQGLRSTSKFYEDILDIASGKIRWLRSENRKRELAEHGLSLRLQEEKAQEDALKLKIASDANRVSSLQQALIETQSKAEDPAITKWIRKRVEGMGSVLDGPSSGQELGKLVEDAFDSARNSVGALENEVEKHISSPLLSVILSSVVVIIPALAVAWGASRLSKAITCRQYILLIHLFNFTLFSAVSFFALISGYDPLIALHRASPHYMLAGMVLFYLQFPVMLYFLLRAAFGARDSKLLKGYTAQALLFFAVGFHVCQFAHRNILYGAPENVFSISGSNLKSYIIYLLATAAMIVQTISLADKKEELVSDLRLLLRGGMNTVEEVFDMTLGSSDEERPEVGCNFKSDMARRRSLPLLTSSGLASDAASYVPSETQKTE